LPKGNLQNTLMLHPRKHLRYFIGQNISARIANQFADANLVLPWFFTAIGGPHFLASLILPLMHAGVFVSQLMASTILEAFALRKWIVLTSYMATALLLVLLSITTMHLPLGLTLILFLAMNLALGLLNGIRKVALLDLMAKIINRKEMAGHLTLENSLGGILILVLAGIIHFLNPNPESIHSHLLQISIGSTLFVVAGLFLFGVAEKESPVHLKKKFNFNEGFQLVTNQPWFLKFLTLKTLFLSVGLAPAFYSIHAATLHKNSASTLSVFIFASALGALVSKPFWDPLQKTGIRFQFSLAAAIAGVAGFYSLVIEFVAALRTPYYHAPAFFLIILAVTGNTISRVIYFNDKVPEEDRTKYLGVDGTIMTVISITGSFLIGILATMTHPKFSLMVLILLNILAGFYCYFSSCFKESQ
jgi:hypothetical protein